MTTNPPNRLREHREQRGLTLKQLSRMTGSTPTHLSQIERGIVRPIGLTQERIARRMGIDRRDLFPEPAEAAS